MYANFEIMYAHQKLVLDKRRPKKENLFPVKIRITHQRIQRYYAVGIDMSEIDFDRINNNSVRIELRTAKKKVLLFQSKVQHIIDSLEDFTFPEFEKKFLKKKDAPEPKEKEIFNYFEDVIDQLTTDGRIGSANAYKGAYNSLKSFMPGLTFIKVDVPFLKEYEAKMKRKGRSISTIGIYLRHLRAIYNKAIEKGRIDQKDYPFGKNKFQIKAPRNIKKALTIDQIKKIIDYKVSEGTPQQFAKDIWLFSYMSCGMNIKDIVNLKFKNIHEDTIQYDRAKTSNTIQNPKPIVINLLPQSIEIIERWCNSNRKENNYIFPILKHQMDEIQKQKVKDQLVKTINHYMKRIGEEIGLEKKLTTYAARHSFATVLKRSGAPMELISESLGHKSLQTTEAYLDSFEDNTRRKFMENLIPK